MLFFIAISMQMLMPQIAGGFNKKVKAPLLPQRRLAVSPPPSTTQTHSIITSRRIASVRERPSGEGAGESFKGRYGRHSGETRERRVVSPSATVSLTSF